MKNCFIILAAGKSERFKSSIPKPYYIYKGKPMFLHSVEKAAKSKLFNKIIFVINKKNKKYINSLHLRKIDIINGGINRSESSKIAVKYIQNKNFSYVFIHDSARPNFSIKLIKEIYLKLKKFDCVVPAIGTVDSVKYKINNKLNNLNRENIFLTQTPQGYKTKSLIKLQKKVSKKITDEANLFISNNKKIKLINGEDDNFKITKKSDIYRKLKMLGVKGLN